MSSQHPQHHNVLAEPWTYEVVGIAWTRDMENQRGDVLSLTLRKDGTTVCLEFRGVSDLEIDAGFPWHSGGLQILDESTAGMEDARVRVNSFEPSPSIRFWARSVERVGA